MKVFETKIRGFHAKTVENIMSRTISAPKLDKTCKSPARKGDNIATYLRKVTSSLYSLKLIGKILTLRKEFCCVIASITIENMRESGKKQRSF